MQTTNNKPRKPIAGDQNDLVHFREFQKSHDPHLRDDLVLKYQRLAEKIARRYAGCGEPIEDVIQEGYIGLIKAVDRFDPELGVQFTTYATHAISGQIRHFLRDSSKIIKEPGWHSQLRYRILKAAEELTQKMGRQPGSEEIALALEMNEKTVRAVLESGTIFQLESLDAPEEDSGEDSRSRWERLDCLTENGFRDLADHVALRDAISQLKQVEQEVIYYFYYEEHTMTEISQILNISVNYASYLVKRAVRNLKMILLRPDEEAIQTRPAFAHRERQTLHAARAA